MSNINILDCTLRDGGYVNKFEFDDLHTRTIIKKLEEGKIDIIECGFIDEINGKPNNLTRFDSCNTINNLLSKITLKGSSLFVVMIEFGKVKIENIPNVVDESNQIQGIRLSFRKSDHLLIFKYAQQIIDKGYKLFIQPIATELYSDEEIIQFIQKCNELKIEAMYIVDTHGSMMRDDVRRLYYLFEHNLNKNIRLGFHSHNNLQLSYSNAIDFIEISQNSGRDIILDASIYGMGRGAGNLNTELLSNYLNQNLEKNYFIEPLLDVVDEYLSTIYKKERWGYSLEHFLSASEHCHPNYASALINKKNLSIIEIKKLLALIPKEERREFNIKAIEEIYSNYKEELKLPLKRLPNTFYEEKMLLLASGKSVEKEKDFILSKIEKLDLKIIGLNHINLHVTCHYVFFSNQLRYDEFCDLLHDGIILIVTSNIKVRSNHKNCYVLGYKELFEYKNLKVDNSAILMLNLLIKHKLSEVYIGGLDGYNNNEDESYSYREYNRVIDDATLEKINVDISTSIEKISKEIHITYLTPSRFKYDTKQKIIGVIPSRFNSTRLPGKPLKEIAGLPMIIHVLKRASMSTILDEVIVATDDQRIFDVVESYGGKAIMTSVSHDNGSERMYEVSLKIIGDIFVVINGDEALLQPNHIDIGVKALLQSDAPVSLLYNKFTTKNSSSDFKVVLNNKKEIMYISRNDIPSNTRMEVPFMYKAYHIMSFTKEFLETYITLAQTPLDKFESHELLRVLENGYKIQGVEVESSAISVDTEDDLKYVSSVMDKDEVYKVYKK